MGFKINYKNTLIFGAFVAFLIFIYIFFVYFNSQKQQLRQEQAVFSHDNSDFIDVSDSLNGVFKEKTYFSEPKPPPNVLFLNPNGKNVTWSDFKGKYTLINIWATWCPPCVVELPSLQKLGEMFEGKGLNVIGISADLGNNQDNLRKFLNKRNVSDFALYFDKEGEIQKNIPLRGLPTSFLLNPKGELLYIFEGNADWSSPVITDFFDNLLN